MKERRAEEAGNKYAFVLQCHFEFLVLIPTTVQRFLIGFHRIAL